MGNAAEPKRRLTGNVRWPSLFVRPRTHLAAAQPSASGAALLRARLTRKLSTRLIPRSSALRSRRMTSSPMIAVEPLTRHIGARVTGLDLREELSTQDIAALRRAWLDHIVLVFPGQDLSQE